MTYCDQLKQPAAGGNILLYNRGMSNLHLFHLSPPGWDEVFLPDMSSLDAVTRQLPPGLYTTFRTYDERRRVLGLRLHLERIYGPAQGLGLHPPLDQAALRRVLSEILAGYSGEVRLRLVLAGDSRLYAAIEPLIALPLQVYEQGVQVVTVRLQRHSPRLKSTAFIEQSESPRRLLAESGAFEALMVRRGYILEGLTSNFFYVQNGVLGTARRGILLGVTRRTVLRLARQLGMEVCYRPARVDTPFDEAFLTSSSRGVVPIVAIDGKAVGDGRVGPWTRQLGQAYDAYVLQAAEKL